MTEYHQQGDRKAWATPELRRIDAGSAEAVKDKGKNDGGGGSGLNFS